MLGKILDKLRPFSGSQDYWKKRYQRGGNSGVGSYGKFAEFKAEVLNAFVSQHDIRSVIEFGCGDGNQLKFAQYRSYIGFDISQEAIAMCQVQFPQYTFKLTNEYRGESAELALSLDVIYHLIEDDVYDEYMRMLFGAATRYVIVYSSNHEGRDAPHVRHRRFTDWVETSAPLWRLTSQIPNRYRFAGDYRKGSFADFYIFSRQEGTT